MERIGDLPNKLKNTEATLLDGQVIVRSGKDEGKFYFPSEEFTSKKYSECLEENRYNNEVKSFSPEFKLVKQGIYKGSFVCDHIIKGSGQANDKLFLYDEITGAHYSMDVQDVFSLLKGISEFSHNVIESGGKYIISGNFILRGHFLSPYIKEIKKEYERFAELDKQKLNAKEIIPSIRKIYLNKKGEEFMYLGTGNILCKYAEYYTNIANAWHRETVEEGHICLKRSKYSNDYFYTVSTKNKSSSFCDSKEISEEESNNWINNWTETNSYRVYWEDRYIYHSYKAVFPEVNINLNLEWKNEKFKN